MIRKFLDDKGRIHLFNLKARGKDAHRLTSKQIGHVKDSELTCASCDNRIGQWEKYANEVLYLRSAPSLTIRPRTTRGRSRMIHSEQLEGVNYEQFKLFLLSLLWRASASRLPFVSTINLGALYDGVIRERLLKSDPGPPEEFPCVLFKMTDAIRQPLSGSLFMDCVKIQSRAFFRFLIDRFLFLFAISHAKAPYPMQFFTLDKSGTMRCFEWKLADLEYILSAWSDFSEANASIRLQDS